MISLLAPLGLLALLGLAVPLLIHRIRRPEKRVVMFAALRWLRPQALAKQSWQWHEKRLLALRLLLLGGLALLLAMPVWQRTATAGPRWVLVHPALTLEAARAVLTDRGTPWHWLAPGFPAIGATDPPGAPNPPAPSDFSSLLREVDAALPPGTALTVLVPQQLAGADAQRLRLLREVDWRALRTASLPPAARPTDWPIALRHDRLAAEELPVARALMQAWQAQGRALGLAVSWAEGEPRAAEGDNTAAPIPPQARSLLWLAAGRPPVLQRWLDQGGSALASRQRCTVDERAAFGDGAGEGVGEGADDRPAADAGDPVPMARRSTSASATPPASASPSPSPGAPVALGEGRFVCLPTALTPQATPALRDPALPARWLAVLAPPSMRPLPVSASAQALAPLKLAERPVAEAGVRLDASIAVLVALLFAAERLWATRRPAGERPKPAGAPVEPPA